VSRPPRADSGVPVSRLQFLGGPRLRAGDNPVGSGPQGGGLRRLRSNVSRLVGVPVARTSPPASGPGLQQCPGASRGPGPGFPGRAAGAVSHTPVLRRARHVGGRPSADCDTAIAPHAQGHPDVPLFDALPGAGAVFAPRLLVAFGAQRERSTSADDLQKDAGIAPVTERSGKPAWGHWRCQCPKFLRHTFVAWAAASVRHAFWARIYYQQQRDKGKAHQAAVRALACTWIRILFRCW
jgi:hypothetical protein